MAYLLSVVVPPGATSEYRGLFVWLGAMVLLLLVGFGGYSLLKRWMRADEPSAGEADGRGFGLSDLRQLHREGKLSTEEFEATRAKIVAAAKRQTDAMPAVTPKRADVGPKPETRNPNP